MARKKGTIKNPDETERYISIGEPDADGWAEVGASSGGLEIDEVHEGIYYGIKRFMESERGAPPVPYYTIGNRELLGSTILKSKIEGSKAVIGDSLRVLRIADIAPKIKGFSPTKNFQVWVNRQTSGKPGKRRTKS